ncbi:MAG: hypothetical protein ACRDPE_01295 [Solirubrobacterales bacterium]
MRRALVIAGAILAGLLASVPGLATAAPSPPEEELEFIEEKEDVLFTLPVEGFTVSVFAEDNDGDQTATLSISRDGLTSAYQVPALITDDSLAAKFGAFGELNFHFGPKKGARKCLGELTFTGNFTFTGENEYIHIDADEAEGGKVGGEFEGCIGSEEEEGGLIAVAEEVHLEAIAGSFERGTGRRVTVDEWQARGVRPTVIISASQIEEKEGMRIARGATLRTRAGSFRHNPKAGTATLKPPAPFTGWARLTPGRGGRGIWEGTLRVPTLEGRPIELTGPAFRARFLREEPFDE